MAVRTLEIANVRNLTSNVGQVLYTVPAGRTLLIKHMAVCAVNAESPGQLYLAVNRAFSYTPFLVVDVPAGRYTLDRHTGVVAEAGDEVTYFLGTASNPSNISMILSGALLAGVAQ